MKKIYIKPFVEFLGLEDDVTLLAGSAFDKNNRHVAIELDAHKLADGADFEDEDDYDY